MDTSQPKRKLKAFLKQATVRISSTKHDGFAHDSYSVDDDGKSQTSSNSVKKDSKLRRIGRGIREWRLKRRSLRGDTHSENPFTLDGKSFSSSEASLYVGSFEEEDIRDEDGAVDRPEDHAHEPSERLSREPPEERFQCEKLHDEVALRQGPAVQLSPQKDQSQTRPRKEVSIPQTSITIPPPAILSPCAGPHLTRHDRIPKPNGVILKRDREHAFHPAQSILDSEPALGTDAAHLPVAPENCEPEHHGEIAVAQQLNQRWTDQFAYAKIVTGIVQLESLTILVAAQWDMQGIKPCTLGKFTFRKDALYLCGDSGASLRWTEKIIDLVTVAGNGGRSERNVGDMKGMVRLSNEMDQRRGCQFREFNCSEKSLAASIRTGILDTYLNLRGHWAWIEFRWVLANARLPGNEISDKMGALLCWRLPKVARRSERDTSFGIEVKVLTYDEPWTRYCPHNELHNEHNLLELLEETKGSHTVIPAKGPVGCITTPVGRARAGLGGLALQCLCPATCRPLQPPPVYPLEEDGEAKLSYSTPHIRIGNPPHGNRALKPPHQLGPTPQPPPTLPQPRAKTQRKAQRKLMPEPSEKLLCTHCWHKGHLIHQCFEKFPEQKVEFPLRYARYVGRVGREKVIPGAFSNLARLHPNLVPRPLCGQNPRYIFGQIGILPYLSARQCAAWAARYQAAQPSPDQQRHLGERYRQDRALDALLD